MPPLPLLPNRPAGQPDHYPTTGGYGSTPAAGGSYQYDGQTVPRATPEDPYAEVRWWQMHSADLADKAFKEQNAFQKLQISNQREDADKALKQAMEIAKLTEQTSRYGTDVGSRDRLAALEVNQQQFRANHALAERGAARDDARLGLDYANAYTNFASTPDRMFMLGDFTEGVNRASQGLGVQPYGSQGQPQAKGWEDFAALSGFGGVPGVQQQAGGSPASGGGGQGGAGGAANPVDPRIKAAKGVLDAIGPSDDYGHDGDSFAALNAVESLFRASKPGSFQRLRHGQKAGVAAGLTRRGYYAPDAIDQMTSNGIGQGSSRSY